MSITMIGLDTAKSVFQIHAVNETGKTEIKRKLSRNDLIPFFKKQELCTVVLEACGAAHHWARILTGLGHDVKLIAPEAEPIVAENAVYFGTYKGLLRALHADTGEELWGADLTTVSGFPELVTENLIAIRTLGPVAAIESLALAATA